MNKTEDCYKATVKLLDGGEMTNEGTQDEMVKWVEYLMQCGETNDVRIIQKQGNVISKKTNNGGGKKYANGKREISCELETDRFRQKTVCRLDL